MLGEIRKELISPIYFGERAFLKLYAVTNTGQPYLKLVANSFFRIHFY